MTDDRRRKEVGRCLFSAPHDFLGAVHDQYQELLPTEFSEAWDRSELLPAPDVVAWIPNPGQRFVSDDEVLDLFPALTWLVTPSTGSNHIDRDACERRGVVVRTLLDDADSLEKITASAEFTFLLLLNTLRRLDRGIEEVRARRWRANEQLLRGRELSGKTIGLVGLGRIGTKLRRYLRAFDADVLGFDPHVIYEAWHVRSLVALFERSDAVCVCCSLTDETHGLIDKLLLTRLKQGACLVNTSRGEVLVENDLAEVLAARSDLRIGLDVLAGEVDGTLTDSPLLPFHDSGQIVVTPHIAGATVESQRKAAEIALGILSDCLVG